MVDVRGDVLRPPHGTTPAAVKSNKNQKWKPISAAEDMIPDSFQSYQLYLEILVFFVFFFGAKIYINSEYAITYETNR